MQQYIVRLLPRNKLPVATASICSHGCLHLCCTRLPSAPLAAKCRRGPRPLCATPTSDACLPPFYLFDWVSSVAATNQTCPTSIHPSFIHSSPSLPHKQTWPLIPSGDVTVICNLPNCDLSVIPRLLIPSRPLIGCVICLSSHLMIMAPCPRVSLSRSA